MPSDEVRAAIERVLYGYKAETFGKLLMFLANEDAVVEMMFSASYEAWKTMPAEETERGGTMRAALKALAEKCRG